MDQWPALVQLAVGVVVLGGLAAAVYSGLRRDRHKELQALADTRGERIDDLEDTVARLVTKVDKLEADLAAQARLVTEDIAARVAELLAPRLPRRSDAPA